MSSSAALFLVGAYDLALPGIVRIKKQGGAGGHNGLTDIETLLGTQNYKIGRAHV